jgi:dGTPase
MLTKHACNFLIAQNHMINFKLATYAVEEDRSRGRLYAEDYDDAKYRSVFGRDRDRIINSSAFRRLQYKTQVFVNHTGDHYRTRLTHSLEVAQIARWIAGALKLNKDLAEIVSLAHDLGHPPFGHAGEDALDACMASFGGFAHNAHTLKILTKIESRFIEFEGLNLSWEMLEGVVKHNGPVVGSKAQNYIAIYNQKHDLELEKFSSLEAQISAISDDIAYNNHDVEDGLRAGLFSFEELFDLPVIGKIYQEILAKYPKITREVLASEAKKHLTLAMVVDVIHNLQNALQENKISTEFEVRNFGRTLVNFSNEMEAASQALKAFLMKRMYRHQVVNEMTNSAKRTIEKLFDFYMNFPAQMPGEYAALAQKISDQETLAKLVCDYIAGMTDRFALAELQRIK